MAKYCEMLKLVDKGSTRRKYWIDHVDSATIYWDKLGGALPPVATTLIPPLTSSVSIFNQFFCSYCGLKHVLNFTTSLFTYLYFIMHCFISIMCHWYDDMTWWLCHRCGLYQLIFWHLSFKVHLTSTYWRLIGFILQIFDTCIHTVILTLTDKANQFGN